MSDAPVAVVTGASSGLGKAIAASLATADYRVVLLSRDRPRGREAYAEMLHISKKGTVEWIPVDLASLASLKEFSIRFIAAYDRVDVLCNCGGSVTIPRELTEDGLEKNFATNYLGHFLLTNLLLDLLKRAAPSRVITVSGRSHRPSATEGVRAGTIHLSDLQFEQNYSFERASKQAVLAKILFTYEFARRHTDDRVAATTLCPGLSRTNLVSGLSWPVRAYMAVRYVLQRAQSPEDAARYFMNLIEGKKWQDISGKYFEGDRGGLVEARSSEESYDTELSRLLWEASERLVGQRFP